MGILSNLLNSLENATEAMAASSKEMSVRSRINAANSISASMHGLDSPEALAIYAQLSRGDDLDKVILMSNQANLNRRLSNRRR